MKGGLLAGLVIGLAACRQAAPAQQAQTTGHTMEVRHVDAAGASRVLEQPGITVLDVRTPGEFETGHLAGATNIDFHGADFESRLDALDREPTVLVYCRSGNRSTRSLNVLEELGFKSVVHLDGGMNAWEGAGQPVER